jgi:hypothetical protein
MSSDLGAVLAANGLGAFSAVFDAEQMTLETALMLDHNLLKGLGIPLGPRLKILSLFAMEPNRPDAPAGSHGSPRHMALLEASVQVPAHISADSRKSSSKKYGCFLSHHKAACAMEGEIEPPASCMYMASYRSRTRPLSGS